MKKHLKIAKIINIKWVKSCKIINKYYSKEDQKADKMKGEKLILRIETIIIQMYFSRRYSTEWVIPINTLLKDRIEEEVHLIVAMNSRYN